MMISAPSEPISSPQQDPKPIRAAKVTAPPWGEYRLMGIDPNSLTSHPSPGAVLVKCSDIKPEPLVWLWAGRIPRGKLTLLVGDPGLGKSLLTLDLVARVTRGIDFPDGVKCEPGSAIIFSCEDDPSDTIRPRLDVAGADVGRVFLIPAVRDVTRDGKAVERSFDLSTDMSMLREAIDQTPDVRLIIIDPVSGYMPGTDSHSNAEVRSMLAPLAKLAADYKLSILAITHLRKSSGQVLHRAIGSIAFAAAARAVWAVARETEESDRRVFLPVKNNLAVDTHGLAFRVEGKDGVARVVWEQGAVSTSIDDILGASDTPSERTERQSAADWLRELLTPGPLAVKEIKAQARNAGFCWRTVERAKSSAHAIAKRAGFGSTGEWTWELSHTPPPYTATSPTVASWRSLRPMGQDIQKEEDRDTHPSIDRHSVSLAAHGGEREPNPPEPNSASSTSAPLQRCRACGGSKFWVSVHGATACATCHPPAGDSSFASWLEVGGK